MTFCDLPIGAKYTLAPSGNGVVLTKTGRWTFTFVDSRNETVRTVNTQGNANVYELPEWRKDTDEN